MLITNKKFVILIPYDINKILIRGEKNMNKIKKLEVYERMLIIVDMVNGFVEEGSLHDKKIGRIIPRQIELIKEAHAKGSLVIFVKDAHNEDAVEFRRFGNMKHCVKGTKEAELVDQLKPFEEMDDTISVEKNSTSFMESPDFRTVAASANNIKKVELAGCCTDICVFNGAMGLANYYDQWNRAVDITAHEDAIATFDEEHRREYVQSAKLLMRLQGINLVSKK